MRPARHRPPPRRRSERTATERTPMRARVCWPPQATAYRRSPPLLVPGRSVLVCYGRPVPYHRNPPAAGAAAARAARSHGPHIVPRPPPRQRPPCGEPPAGGGAAGRRAATHSRSTARPAGQPDHDSKRCQSPGSEKRSLTGTPGPSRSPRPVRTTWPDQSRRPPTPPGSRSE